jgi:hypothetical protein
MFEVFRVYNFGVLHFCSLFYGLSPIGLNQKEAPGVFLKAIV